MKAFLLILLMLYFIINLFDQIVIIYMLYENLMFY